MDVFLKIVYGTRCLLSNNLHQERTRAGDFLFREVVELAFLRCFGERGGA
jgi:hypothetical protein